MFSITQQSLTTLLTVLCAVVMLLTTVVGPRSANAQVLVVDNGVNANTSQIRQLTSAINGLINSLVTKEYRLDPQAQAVTTQQAIQHINLTKAFITSGNNGRSFYTQNLEVLRTEIKVAVTENIIKEISEQGTMCGAYKNEVIAAVKQRFVQENARTAAQKSTCSVAETDNLEAFYNGEFDLSTFYTTTVGDPDNSNPIAAALELEAELERQVDEQMEIEEKYLDWGQGFTNQYEVAQANGGPVMVCADPKQRYATEVNGIRTHECRVATPATIMRERMASMLNIEAALKTNGDEHQETQAQVIDAVIRPTMAGGITGRAQSPIPGVPPPPPTGPNPPNPPGSCTGTSNNPFCAFPQVSTDPTNSTTQQFIAQVAKLLQDTSASSSTPIREYLVRTMTSLQYHLQTIAMTNDAEEEIKAATTKYPSCYTLTLPNSLHNNRILSAGDAPLTIDAIKGLTDLFLRYRQAVSAGQPTTQIEAQFAQLLQTATSALDERTLQVVADQFNANVEDDYAPFKTEHDKQLAACGG